MVHPTHECGGMSPCRTTQCCRRSPRRTCSEEPQPDVSETRLAGRRNCGRCSRARFAGWFGGAGPEVLADEGPAGDAGRHGTRTRCRDEPRRAGGSDRVHPAGRAARLARLTGTFHRHRADLPRADRRTRLPAATDRQANSHCHSRGPSTKRARWSIQIARRGLASRDLVMGSRPLPPRRLCLDSTHGARQHAGSPDPPHAARNPGRPA